MPYISRLLSLFVVMLISITGITHAQDTLKIIADGSQAVPTVATNGTGIFTVIKTEDSLAIKGNFKDLASYYTGAYIHMAERGENGNVLYRLRATDLNRDHTAGKFKLKHNTFHTPDNIENFYKRNMLYLNLATNQNPNGEIRGQIVTK